MISGLVPARFLTLIAHFVLILAIFWSRDENVKAGLPLKYTPRQYEDKDIQFIVALALTLAGFAIEMFGFFGGISTFLPSSGLVSTALHAAACVALAFFIWDVWDCDLYWYIFGFCSALPAVLEIAVIVGVLALKKTV